MELFTTILTLLLFGGYVYFTVSAHNALKDVCEESIKLVKAFTSGVIPVFIMEYIFKGKVLLPGPAVK